MLYPITQLDISQTLATSQKELVGAVCKTVFQKFPDFMRRCQEEAFEAISDPVYSGKMKV